jgi:hypothetical protein
VLDEFGDPVAGVTVAPLRPQFRQGHRRLVTAGSMAKTNDVGEYRLPGLVPGGYAIAATAAPMNAEPGRSDSSTPVGFATTYYPNTPDLGGAERITLGFGQTVLDVDVTLVPARLAEISGAAFDSEGQPLGPGLVHATLRGDQIGLPSNYFGTLNADGTFTVPNLPPGQYLVNATGRFKLPAPGSQPRAQEFVAASVTVNGDDVTGVRLGPVNSVIITGRIVFDDPAAARSVKTSAVQVVPIPMKPDEGMPLNTPVAQIGDDFTFELTASPGHTTLRAAAPPADGRWILKAVRVHGLDITDSGIELRPNQHLDGVEIEFTNRIQQVTGLVTDAANHPASAFTVIVFGKDRGEWSVNSNRYWSRCCAWTNVAENSRYKIVSLPPGDFLAVAVDGEEPPAGCQDPDWLDRMSRDAVRFSLRDGETRQLDLKLTAPRP